MTKKLFFVFSILIFTSLLINCKKQNTQTESSKFELLNNTNISQPVKPQEEEQIPIENLIVSKESLLNNYVLIEENKIYIDGAFNTNSGTVYTLSNNKIGNEKYKFKTFLFNENENILLCESNNFGLSELDDSVEIDNNFIIRFYHQPGLNYVDLYDCTKNEYILSGYEGKLNLENHSLTLLLDSTLNPSDEEKVAKDFLNYKIDGLSNSQINNLQKVYQYKIDYLKNKSTILKGDFLLMQQ